MTYRVAINGFGRIGRDFVRCLVDRGMLGKDLTVVAVNDLWDAPTLAHLLEYDSTCGQMRATVEVDPAGAVMTVDGRRIGLLRQRDPAILPWAVLGVDLVIDSTGRFRTSDDAAMHLSTPPKPDRRTPHGCRPTRSSTGCRP